MVVGYKGLCSKAMESELLKAEEVPRVEEGKAESESTVEVFSSVGLVGEFLLLLFKGFQMVVSTAMRFKD